MTDKGMVVLQACMDSQKYVSGSCIETCPASSYDVDHSINIKVEEVSDVEEEEDPLQISFPGMEAEHAVSCFMSLLTDSRAFASTCIVYWQGQQRPHC
jgi:NAD-dependent dihydropyrimidine dehydrogenase PreA subunit